MCTFTILHNRNSEKCKVIEEREVVGKATVTVDNVQ